MGWNKHYFLYLLFIIIIVSIVFPFPLEARYLNINGNIELSFSDIRSTINEQTTQTSNFQQRYSIGGFGELVTGRIGNYNANFTFLDQSIKTDGESQGNLKLFNYNLNFNLFPRWYPLSVFAQRVTSENEFHQTTKNTIDTFGINWLLTTRYLPRISVSLNEVDTQVNNSTTPEIKVRSANISTSKTIGPTSLNAGYQLTEIDTAGANTLRFHNYNLGLSGAIPLVSSQELTIGLRANYTTNIQTPPTSTAGSEIIQQRSGGATIAYRPRIEWISSFSYDYTDTPTSAQDFRTHIATANITGRPTTTTDIHASYRLLLFDIAGTKTSSNFANIGLGYRPIFGLSTGVEVTGGRTEVSSAVSSSTLFQNYTYFINYNKPFELIQITTGYSISYGNNESNTGTSSSNIINTINLGMSNINTRIVRLAFNYSFTDINQSPGNDQISNYYRLSAESSYFRNILRDGDNLFLAGSISFTDVNISGNTLFLDTKATYYLFPSLTFGSGFNRTDYSKNPAGNQDIVYGEIQAITRLFQRANLILSIKDTFQNVQTGTDRNIIEARSILNYPVGKVLFNLEYRFTDEHNDTSNPRTQFFYIKATRPF